MEKQEIKPNDDINIASENRFTYLFVLITKLLQIVRINIINEHAKLPVMHVELSITRRYISTNSIRILDRRDYAPFNCTTLPRLATRLR